MDSPFEPSANYSDSPSALAHAAQGIRLASVMVLS
jgi:hypothetical protein